jgi:hypothetical protein
VRAEMFVYRVTKYDPAMRDSAGRFSGQDWTSISDIGKSTGGVLLSESDYLRSENAYIEAVRRMFSAAKIEFLFITGLERISSPLVQINDGVLDACHQVKDKKAVSGVELEHVVRGCLREYIWCRLQGAGNSYLHFGYDYYMYIGLPIPINATVMPAGIFLEEFDSPYLDDEE